MTGIYTQKLEPTRFTSWKTSTINSATRTTSGSVFVDDTTSVNRIFSSQLSYNKGAYLLRMLQWKLGDSAFFKAINNYLNDPSVSYGYARTNDLKRHLEAVSKQDLTEFFKDWFYGQGYPTYNVTLNKGDIVNLISVSITQTQSHPSVSFFEMPIPLRFKTSNGKDTTIVVNNTMNAQSFNFDFKSFGSISSVEFDPDLWILSKGNTVTIKTPTQDIDNQSIIKVYPNPVKDELSVSFKNDNSESVNIEIINTVGQSVFREKRDTNAGENTLVLPLLHIESGLYFLKISSDKGLAVKKFMKF
jgi:Secretion system C-terminal sorting domain/Peptidase family M1 domain